MATPHDPTEDMLHDMRLASLIIENAIEYAIFTLDFEGVITSWNKGAERVFGYARKEIVGRNFAVLFIAPDVLAAVPDREVRKAASEGRAEDTRWHLRQDGARFWANGVTMMIPESQPAALLKIVRDETRAKLAEDQRVLLLNELNHRINNTLATVQSVAEHTLRSKGVDAYIRTEFSRRLMALADAHKVLVTENWAGADLREIVEQALNAHRQPGDTRFAIEGPDVRLSPQQAITLAMTLHELATNALKYGALSSPDGGVSIAWNLSHDGAGRRGLTFLWEETGGPEVRPPTTRGFGSQLLGRIFQGEIGGAARIDFAPSGVRCVAELPLPDRFDDAPQTPQSGLPAVEF